MDLLVISTRLLKDGMIAILYIFPPKKNRNRPTITPDPSPTRRQPEVEENRPRVGWGEGALICHAVNNHSPPAASVIVSI